MKLSNGKQFQIRLFRRLKVVAKKVFHIGVTFGEVAEANGEGPCLRCVGKSVQGAQDVPSVR